VTGKYFFSMTIFNRLPQAAGRAGIAKTTAAQCGALGDDVRHDRQSLFRDLVLVSGGTLSENLVQLGRRVIGKQDRVAKTRRQTRVHLQEALHLLWISSGDDHQAVTFILHGFHQGIHRFPAKILAAAAG